MLLLPEPKRFSIDIDIMVFDKAQPIEKVLKDIIDRSHFLEYEEDNRKIVKGIDKKHFKFYYSPICRSMAEKEYILLDILFSNNHYHTHTKKVELTSAFVIMEGNNMKVEVPIPEALMADKLTAYAPNSTGIPYGMGKEIEIVKQLYDIGSLFEIVQELRVIREVFQRFAISELEYRTLVGKNVEDVLDDRTTIREQNKQTEKIKPRSIFLLVPDLHSAPESSFEAD